MALVLETWKRILYAINVCLIVLGFVMLVYAVVSIAAPEQATLPTWMQVPNISIGLFLMFFSAVGLYGAFKAAEKIDMGHINWFLFVYLAVVFMVLIFEIAAVSFVMNSLGYGGQQDRVDQEMVDDWVTLSITNFPDNWLTFQNDKQCCGFRRIDDDLATGETCENLIFERDAGDSELLMTVTFDDPLTADQQTNGTNVFCSVVAVAFALDDDEIKCSSVLTTTNNTRRLLATPTSYRFSALWKWQTYKTKITATIVDGIITNLLNASGSVFRDLIKPQFSNVVAKVFGKANDRNELASDTLDIDRSTDSPTASPTTSPTASPDIPTTTQAPEEPNSTNSSNASTRRKLLAEDVGDKISSFRHRVLAENTSTDNTTASPDNTTVWDGTPQDGTCYDDLLEKLQAESLVSLIVLIVCMVLQCIALVAGTALACCKPASSLDGRPRKKKNKKKSTKKSSNRDDRDRDRDKRRDRKDRDRRERRDSRDRDRDRNRNRDRNPSVEMDRRRRKKNRSDSYD